MKKIAVLAISFFLFTSTAFPCTTFCLKNKGEVLFGKNYDWMIGDGLVFVNKRGVSKVSTGENITNPAKWTSKYGSVTFNQYGWENPMGGMNEAGLVIELMWLDETKYPKNDARATVDVLEWIQFQLDTSATLEEVLKSSETVRIAGETPLHYLVNDKSGNTASVEFLDGKLVAHRGETLPVSALANDTYERSWKYAKETVEFGGAKSTPQTANSLDRFTRAAQKTKEFEKQPKSEKEAVDYAFEVLANVAQNPGTQWSIVYDQKRAKIYFRSRQSTTVKSVDIKSFDFACGSKVKIFDINSKETGDVAAKFTYYTRAANRDLIERSFTRTDFLKNVPAETKDFLAAYPENFPCEARTKQKTETKTKAAALPSNFDMFYFHFRTISALFLIA